MSCPERSQLEALMRGELAPAVAAALREHAAGCDDCTAVLEQLEARPAVRSVGRYVLVAEVGRGGMGRVFRAFDPQLERTVAVKLVRSDRQSPTENQQLLGEARAMAKLAHPHLVTVFDSGEDGGEVYIAMEYLTGQTLAEWLRAPRSLSDVVRVFGEAGAGLLAAHRAGLVHRDFKPANVLLHDGLAKVSDFGLAQPVDTRGRSDSAGTAEYMAPEQRSGFADARSDQYAFGRSLAEALRLQRAAAPWLERIVARATAREPAERFPSMVEVLDALSRDPSLVRRRLAATGAVVVALTLAVVAVWDARRRRQAECDGGDLRVAQEWSAERRAALERQLTSALAPDGARTELQALEDWANAWRGTRREVCVASRVRGDLSDELFTLETLCLDRQMAGFATVVARAAAGEVGVEALVGAISELPKVKDCTDAEALVFRTASESGLERRNAQPIRERLDQASALSQLGKEPEAEQLATEALELARASGARPVLSEALLLSGQLQQRAGEKVAARKLLDEAYALATGARHDVVAAHAAMDILVTYAGEPEALAATMLFANAAADRAGRTPFTEARWSYRLGQVFARQSRFAEAEPRFRRALELREQLFGPTAPATQAARTNLAITLEQQARFDEALALYRAVLASDEQLYGAESALATRDLATLASGLVAAHRLDEAVPLLETAKARLEQRGRLEAEALFDVINNLAVVHESQRRWKAALPLRRRLIEVTDDPELQVVGRALLGRVLLELGERREAEALSLEAKAELEKVRADHPDLVLPLTTLARLETDPHKAKASLQRALSLKEATDAEFLGDAEWALAALESGARGAELRAKALAHYQEANVVPPP